MRIFIFIFPLIFFICQNLSASEASDWLKSEIDIIVDAYKNINISKETKFLMIEDTINYKFAGKALGKAVAKKAYNSASTEHRKIYIRFFKRHLALYIASMMQGYSDQNYEIISSKFNEKNKTTMIDMKIYSESSSIVITWRVIKHKDSFYVIDLYIANISLMQAKRSEFNSILKNINNDLEEFNKILKKQNNESYSKLIN